MLFRDILMSAAQGGGRPFSPADISGLVMWLDADEIAGSNNDPVASWTDLSGTGNHMLQADGGKQPLLKTGMAAFGGGSAVEFNGTDDFLLAANNFPAPCSIFLVAKSMTAGVNERVMGALVNNWLLGWHSNTYDDAFFAGTVRLGGPASTTAVRRYSAVLTGAVSSLWGEGALIASNSGGLAGPNRPVLGSQDGTAEFTHCQISKVLIYNSALSDANRQRVEAYLAT